MERDSSIGLLLLVLFLLRRVSVGQTSCERHFLSALRPQDRKMDCKVKVLAFGAFANNLQARRASSLLPVVLHFFRQSCGQDCYGTIVP